MGAEESKGRGVTSITVTKLDDGRLDGFTDKDQRAYAKFKAAISSLGLGELFTLSTWFPRNPKLHKLHFAVIKAVFDAQEQFEDADDLRKWLYVGAGYADFLPGPKGKMVAIPKSVSFERIDDGDFSELHRKVCGFTRTEYATRFLWPHLTSEEQMAMVARLLDGFDK